MFSLKKYLSILCILASLIGGVVHAQQISNQTQEESDKRCKGVKDGVMKLCIGNYTPPGGNKAYMLEGTCVKEKCDFRVAGCIWFTDAKCEPLHLETGAQSGSMGGGLGNPFLTQALSQAVSQILQSMMQGKQGSGQGSGNQGGGGTGATGVTNSIGSQLADQISGNTGPSIADTLNNLINGSSSNAQSILEKLTEVVESSSSSRPLSDILNEVVATTPNGSITGLNVTGTSSLLNNASTTEDVQGGEYATTTLFSKKGFSVFSLASFKNGQLTTGFISGLSSTFASARTSALARLCAARPWAKGLISNIFSAESFDAACIRYGYTGESSEDKNVQVGLVPTVSKADIARAKPAQLALKTRGIECSTALVEPRQPVVVQWNCGPTSTVKALQNVAPTQGVARMSVFPKGSMSFAVQCSDGFVDQCSVQMVAPSITLFATNAPTKRIPLGVRAILRWDTKDMRACRITGPNFDDRRIRGDASTVPLFETTVYTATCVSIAGGTTTKSLILDIGQQ
jgi:hypothetical protein